MAARCKKHDPNMVSHETINNAIRVLDKGYGDCVNFKAAVEKFRELTGVKLLPRIARPGDEVWWIGGSPKERCLVLQRAASPGFRDMESNEIPLWSSMEGFFVGRCTNLNYTFADETPVAGYDG